MLGRVFNGAGEPIDGGPAPCPERRADINGTPLNPAAREKPADFIQTGISAIDGLNTLVRGQKLPIFSGAGLPANELAAQIVRPGQGARRGRSGFAVVFAAMGITCRDASFFLNELRGSRGALDRTVIYPQPGRRPDHRAAPHAALRADRGRVPGLRARAARARRSDRHDELLRGGAGGLHGPRGDPRAPRLPGLPVQRPRHASTSGPGGSRGRTGSITQIPDPQHARRRRHPPHPGPDRLHHRGADRPLPGAAPQGGLPADRRPPLALAPHESRHRRGQDARGPQGGLRPALLGLRPGAGPQTPRDHRRRRRALPAGPQVPRSGRAVRAPIASSGRGARTGRSRRPWTWGGRLCR